MSSRLFELSRPHATLSIVGTAKNVGKTTVLNHLIAAHQAEGTALAITSVGRDGEDLDAITDRPKPRISPPIGAWVATSELSARRATAALTRLEATRFRTALGPVGIYRVDAPGSVEVAGPVTVAQTLALNQRLRELGARTVLVDGALDRRASASGRVADGAILATGLAFDPDPEVVAAHTAVQVRWLTLPGHERADDRSGAWLDDGDFVAWPETDWLDRSDALARWLPARTRTLVVRGAFTERVAEGLLSSGASELEVVVEDGTHLLASDASYTRLEGRGMRFFARHPLDLIAVTLNPTDPWGRRVDPEAFLSLMRERLAGVSVFDVELAEGPSRPAA